MYVGMYVYERRSCTCVLSCSMFYFDGTILTGETCTLCVIFYTASSDVRLLSIRNKAFVLEFERRDMEKSSFHLSNYIGQLTAESSVSVRV